MGRKFSKIPTYLGTHGGFEHCIPLDTLVWYSVLTVA